MRFSTVVAVSAALFAGSALAAPRAIYSRDLEFRENALQARETAIEREHREQKIRHEIGALKHQLHGEENIDHAQHTNGKRDLNRLAEFVRRGYFDDEIQELAARGYFGDDERYY